MKRLLARWILPACTLALALINPATAGNGVGPGGFTLEIIAFENCPSGDFTNSNRRMIAVQANYQVLAGELKSNQNKTALNELVRNNTISLAPGDGFQVVDGNACGSAKQDAELMLPITDENCDPCEPTNVGFTEYRVELALVGKPGSAIGVSSCGAEPTEVDVNGDGVFDQVLCSTEDNVLVKTRRNGKPVWDDVSTELLTVCLDIADDVTGLDGVCDQRVGIFDTTLFGYFWQWNTQGRPHAKVRFIPVAQ